MSSAITHLTTVELVSFMASGVNASLLTTFWQTCKAHTHTHTHTHKLVTHSHITNVLDMGNLWLFLHWEQLLCCAVEQIEDKLNRW